MITPQDIWDKICEFWAWLRNGFIVFKTAICKLPALIAAPFIAAYAAVKGVYNHVIEFVNLRVAELQGSLDTLSDGVKEGAANVSSLQFLEAANAIFPITELISIALMLLGLWAVCLVVKLAVRLFNILMEVIPG